MRIKWVSSEHLEVLIKINIFQTSAHSRGPIDVAEAFTPPTPSLRAGSPFLWTIVLETFSQEAGSWAKMSVHLPHVYPWLGWHGLEGIITAAVFPINWQDIHNGGSWEPIEWVSSMCHHGLDGDLGLLSPCLWLFTLLKRIKMNRNQADL
jgi:hypothetical protein